jgi:hypothetical protein
MTAATRDADDASQLSALSPPQSDLAVDTSRTAEAAENNALAREFLEAAADAMQDAAASLQDARDTAAAKERAAEDQRSARDLLEGARSALENPAYADLFEALSDSAADLASAAEAVEELNDLIDEQVDLKKQTEAAENDPSGLSAVQPPQQALAGRTRDFAERTDQRMPGNTAQAAQAMSEAAVALGDADEALAARRQEEALDALRETRRELAERMTASAEQLDSLAANAGQTTGELPRPLDDLVENTRRMSQSARQAGQAYRLAREERMLERGAGALERNDDTAFSSAAARQDQLSERTGALAAESDEHSPDFANAASQARGHMQSAAGALRGGDPLEARGNMNDAASSLDAAARFALRKTSASAIPAPSAGTTGRGIQPGEARPGGRLADRTLGDAWRARLPDSTPPDIQQAARSAFPQGYEEVLRRYYERLATEDSTGENRN